MILQNLKCPYGCEKTTFGESVRIEQTQNEKLLQEGLVSPSKKIKVYTCNCCGGTFEVPITEGHNMLHS